MRNCAVFLLLCSCSQGVSSFSLNNNIPNNVKSSKVAAPKQHDMLPEQIVRAFGVAAAVLTFHTAEASAATSFANNNNALSAHGKQNDFILYNIVTFYLTL